MAQLFWEDGVGSLLTQLVSGLIGGIKLELVGRADVFVYFPVLYCLYDQVLAPLKGVSCEARAQVVLKQGVLVHNRALSDFELVKTQRENYRSICSKIYL